MCRLIDVDKLLDDMKKELEKAVNDEKLNKDECMLILTSAIALKDFVNRQPTVHKSLRYMYEKGYNNGVDETCNYICREWSLDRINTCEDFDKISQQLKGR